MDLAYQVFIQVLIMFVLILIGFFITKIKLFNESGKAQFSEVLLTVVSPCVIINAFQVEFHTDLARNLLLAFICAILVHLIAIIVAKIFCNKNTIENFSIIYSNCGFMAIPLLQAVLGSEGVFYGAAYLAVFNALAWTHGVYVFTKGEGFSAKKLFLNPGIIGVAVGIVLFFARIRIPYIIMQPMQYIAGLNTPVAMLLLGAFLAGVNFGDALKKPSLYIISMFRLILIPVICAFILKIFNLDEIVYLAVLIPSACPIATMVALFAQRYNQDRGYASQLVAINTVISILTIPLIVYISALIR